MSQRNIWIGSAGGLAVAAVVLVWWWSRPPQMGNDSELMETVDALFTAVSSRDQKRLAQCEKRLAMHKNEGNVTPEAARWLETEISRARSGEWKAASERLYAFMLAQRRDGAHEHKKIAKKA